MAKPAALPHAFPIPERKSNERSRRLSSKSIEQRLEAFARTTGLSLPAEQKSRLARLDGLMKRVSRAVSLAGFRTEEERFARYLAEALMAAEWLPEHGTAVDIGSGGGSPALPMAIRRPGLAWTLLEPRRRKAVFLETTVEALGLDSVAVVRARLEDYAPPTLVDVVTSRGLAMGKGAMARVLGWLAPGGRWLLITGERVAGALERRPGSMRLTRRSLEPASRAVLMIIEKTTDCFT